MSIDEHSIPANKFLGLSIGSPECIVGEIEFHEDLRVVALRPTSHLLVLEGKPAFSTRLDPKEGEAEFAQKLEPENNERERKGLGRWHKMAITTTSDDRL